LAGLETTTLNDSDSDLTEEEHMTQHEPYEQWQDETFSDYDQRLHDEIGSLDDEIASLRTRRRAVEDAIIALRDFITGERSDKTRN
jgi:hypothetical protein